MGSWTYRTRPRHERHAAPCTWKRAPSLALERCPSLAHRRPHISFPYTRRPDPYVPQMPLVLEYWCGAAGSTRNAPGAGCSSAEKPRGLTGMDIVYVGLTALFFALSFGFVALCDRLGGER